LKEKLLKNRKLVDTIILILVGCFLCIPLLSSNTNVYADDGIQHIARAFGTLNSITEANRNNKEDYVSLMNKNIELFQKELYKK